MKKFIVKTTSYATNENPNFKGQVSIGYYGKNQKLIGHEGSHAEANYTTMLMSNYFIEEYGYNRLCDAKKSWIFKNPENTKFWKTTVEVVQMDI